MSFNNPAVVPGAAQVNSEIVPNNGQPAAAILLDPMVAATITATSAAQVPALSPNVGSSAHSKVLDLAKMQQLFQFAKKMKEEGRTDHPKYKKLLNYIAQQQQLRRNMSAVPEPAQEGFTSDQLKTLQEQIQSYKMLRQSLDEIADQINRQRANDARIVEARAEQRRAEQAHLAYGYAAKKVDSRVKQQMIRQPERNVRQYSSRQMPIGPTWNRAQHGLIYLGPSKYDGDACPVPPAGFGPTYRLVDSVLEPVRRDRPLSLSCLKQERAAKVRNRMAKIKADLECRHKEIQKKSEPDKTDNDDKTAAQGGDRDIRESTWTQDDQVKLLALQCFSMQQKMRQSIAKAHKATLNERRNNQLHNYHLQPRATLRRNQKQSRREVKLFEAKQRKIQLVRDNQLKAKHNEYLKKVMQHQRAFKDFHKQKTTLIGRCARSVKNELDARAVQAQREEGRVERARLKALKDNDMDAYMKLVEETKNERLTYLLRQTDEYLASINNLIKAQSVSAAVGKGGAAAGAGSGASARSGGDGGGDGEGQQFEMEEQVERQPQMLVGGELKNYQLKGVQWMVNLYNKNLNGILADEMGLGKTIQTIGLITYIMEKKNNNGPFLVVVPLSTLSNWVNEFTKWAPDCVVVVYKGAPQIRKDIYRDEMASGVYNVLLTTYEYIMKDKAVLKKTYWQYIIVDEGHRMKNAQSKFAQTLGTVYQSRNRILLTGTPLQNNLVELWALLNFLLPKIFNSVDNFEMWFNQPFSAYQGANSKENQQADLSEEERILIINRLHEVLRPFVMRRIKDNVLDQLPEKTEKVVRCELSAWQKVAYRQIQEHGTTMSDPTSSKGKVASKGLSNILMQLRKICNHPYLFYMDSYNQGIGNFAWANAHENLYRSSGKFELLDRMLPKLKRAGHRVLMFSQMTQLMELLEDYFRWRGYSHLRLDGSTSAEEREQRMFKFNAPDSPYFIFLLSTRAGGLGLNLATADTVILFDSDWNPQMDKQAQDRAHRIGQKNEVRVLRLVTNSPIEEKILRCAQDKMAVTGLVVDAGRFNKQKGKKKSEEAEQERRAILQDMLRDKESLDDKQSADEKVESDEALNRQIAVGDDEFELYQRMDAERHAAELAEAKRLGLKKPKSRLMEDADVPEWVQVPPELLDSSFKSLQDQEAYGRGARERKETVYNDGLTDKQFTSLVETSNQDDFEKNMKKKISKKRDASAIEGSSPALSSSPPDTKRMKAESTASSNAGALSSSSSSSASSAQGKGKRKSAGKLTAKEIDKLCSAETMTPEQQEWAQKQMFRVFKEVKQLSDSSQGWARLLCELFNELPSRELYPDYYQLINAPIALAQIEERLTASSKRRSYSDYELSSFQKDVKLLSKNACNYNQSGSQVFVDAQKIEKFVDKALKKVKDSLVEGTLGVSVDDDSEKKKKSKKKKKEKKEKKKKPDA